MDELGKALAEAVRAGAPIAANAVMWYFIRDIVSTVLSASAVVGSIGIVACTVYKLIRNYQRLIEIGKT